jgi:hypothetical protein
MRKYIVPCAALATVVALTAACGKGGGSSGTSSTSSTSSPAQPAPLPADVPIYPGSSAQLTATDPSGTLATFASSAAPQDVLAYYKAQLPGEGWTLGAETQSGSQLTLAASKGTRTLDLAILGALTPTQIVLNLEG